MKGLLAVLQALSRKYPIRFLLGKLAWLIGIVMVESDLALWFLKRIHVGGICGIRHKFNYFFTVLSVSGLKLV